MILFAYGFAKENYIVYIKYVIYEMHICNGKKKACNDIIMNNFFYTKRV